ncbi:MAG TPA: flavodoxin family protein [Bacteroidales bacterium]|nr:flavodoxin family protein [Bacteroidales bacterium]
MKVTAFVGNAQKRHTYNATEQFLKNLQSLGDIECEIVQLSDYHLGTCKGCRLCIDKGEELCPLKDDRDLLIQKMMNSDGVVFSSPNYSFQVSAWMKIFLDRLGFVFHRPRFFGITFTSLVNQGIYGGNKIVKYLNFIANGLGFNVVKGCCILTIVPIPEKTKQKNDEIIERQSRRFYARLINSKYPSPSMLKLFLFRMARSSMKIMLDETNRDYAYYLKNGWFESDYYYPVKLSPLQKWFGKLFDWRVACVARTKNRVGVF